MGGERQIRIWLTFGYQKAALRRTEKLNELTKLMPGLYCLLGFSLAAVHAVVILRYIYKTV
jgi:hypothetical protein